MEYTKFLQVVSAAILTHKESRKSFNSVFHDALTSGNSDLASSAMETHKKADKSLYAAIQSAVISCNVELATTVPSMSTSSLPYAKVFLELSNDDIVLGKLVIELSNETPLTSALFKALCTGENGYGTNGKALTYKGSKITPSFSEFLAHGGCIVNADGS